MSGEQIDMFDKRADETIVITEPDEWEWQGVLISTKCNPITANDIEKAAKELRAT